MKGLLEKYSGSLDAALRNLFPRFHWNELSTVSVIMQASKPQKSLEAFAKCWFPNENIHVNYRHPGLIHCYLIIHVKIYCMKSLVILLNLTSGFQD